MIEVSSTIFYDYIDNHECGSINWLEFKACDYLHYLDSNGSLVATLKWDSNRCYTYFIKEDK